MPPSKRRVKLRSDTEIPVKRNTPLKVAPRQRYVSKPVVFIRRCDTLLEEPEVVDGNQPAVKTVNPVKVSAAPLHCKRVPGISTPASYDGTRTSTPVTPANKQPYLNMEEMIMLEAFKSEETPGSVTSYSTEPTFNSDDDDEDDDDDTPYSSSSTLSSLPSPEIFRKESSAFPNEDELLGLHFLHVKNSTLLDVSHAENVHTHHPSNISAILDASTSLAAKNHEISQPRRPEDKSKPQMDSESRSKGKASPKLTWRTHVVRKKKVWFKSPIAAEISKAKPFTSSTSTLQNTSESSSPRGKVTPDTKIGCKTKTSPHLMTLKIPVKSGSEQALFFDFVSNDEREAFFKKMRERCAKLTSSVFFPFGLGAQNSL
nr:uncharacterized protein LOC107386828 isoform X1 [Nothobranchius furzeri]